MTALGLDADSLPEPFLMRFLRARNFNTNAAGRILCRYLVRPRLVTLESSLGDAKSSLGDTLKARWVTLRARWVTL